MLLLYKNNTMIKKHFLWLLMSFCFLATSAWALPEKHFKHPDRIKYDQNCFQIEGRDVFVFSAAFHYFRVPQELWRDRFRKIKEAGFNTVETYVPWNWHERNMPKNVRDFSQCDFSDLKEWLRMAHEEFDLYTIVRPGPFICAEWAGGAYPRWLAKYCPEKYETSFWLRSNHPEHLKWARHWYDAVCPVFAQEQITRKKPGEKGIIMVQLENEYIYFGMESEKKKEVLAFLSKACTDNGIDVPLFTCVTPEVRGASDEVISQLFDMDNQYVWWNVHEAKSRIENLKKEQPNAPAFVCELQGGWFSTVGGGLSEDSYLDGRHARGMALMAMAGGATGLNYYMFFGGTHFAGWGARRMTTTYDYGAALKENGGVGEKYFAVKAVGRFVAKYGTALAQSAPVAFTANVPEERLTVGVRQAKDGTLFFFFFNRDKKERFNNLVQIQTKDGKLYPIACVLDALDSKVLVLPSGASQGFWYPENVTGPARLSVHGAVMSGAAFTGEQNPADRPALLPLPIRISSAEYCVEPFCGDWQKLKRGVSLPELDVNDCRYSMYRSRVKLSEKDVQKYGSLIFEMYTGDPMYVQVNGKVVPRASEDELDNTFLLKDVLHAGENEIVAVYENRGHAHGYRPMEELSGMKTGGLGAGMSEVIPVEEWMVKKMDSSSDTDIPEFLSNKEGWDKIMLDAGTIADLATLQIAGLKQPKWPAAWVLQQQNGTAVYRTTLHFTDKMLREGTTVLEFACVDDGGALWVNGKKVAEHQEWDKPFITDLADYLHAGDNEVAIVVSNNSGAGGLLKAVRLYRAMTILKTLNWEVSTDLGGVCAGFTEGRSGKYTWKPCALKTDGVVSRKGSYAPAGERDGLLKWYRVKFNLPKKEKGIWVPWRALVNASGSGYMWLNGHNIGRYGEEGPQREFFLPECWLKFGEENVLILGLRESEQKGALLESLEILPYYEDAEYRADYE